MANLDSINELKGMEDVEIKKLAKPDLIRALKTAISHISQESKFDQILNELRTLKDEKNSMLTDIKNLKDENEKCHKILAQHQKVLESIDADRRATNLIISGVAEEDPLSDNGNVANNDVEKVSLRYSWGYSHRGYIMPISEIYIQLM